MDPNERRKMFDGRNGPDEMANDASRVSVVAAIGFVATGLILPAVGGFFFAVAIGHVAYSLFRSFSRDVEKRHQENEAYIEMKDNVLARWSQRSRMRQQERQRAKSQQDFSAEFRSNEAPQDQQPGASQRDVSQPANNAASPFTPQAVSSSVTNPAASSAVSDMTHEVFVCQGCGQKLRVSRNAGTIQVTCPSCGRSFNTTT